MTSAGGVVWYEELRDAHRPQRVRLLLIGESPPDPRDGPRRFFYAPTLAVDNLYRGVAEALYGEEGTFELQDKPSALRRMRDDGVWLIDAVQHPVNRASMAERRKALRAGRRNLVEACAAIDPTVGVIVCHSVVFKEVAPQLRAADVSVLHDTALPFPLGNTRRRFVEGARASLQAAGWWG
jgi:hypothetical protein